MEELRYPTMSTPPSLDNLDGIAALYPHEPDHFDIVRAQVEQRAQLAKAWDIKPGEKVLEIGCGQGDCTVVLATAVGVAGSVTAVDPASLDYGEIDFFMPAGCSLSPNANQAPHTRSDKRKRTSAPPPSDTASTSCRPIPLPSYRATLSTTPLQCSRSAAGTSQHRRSSPISSQRFSLG